MTMEFEKKEKVKMFGTNVNEDLVIRFNKVIERLKKEENIKITKKSFFEQTINDFLNKYENKDK